MGSSDTKVYNASSMCTVDTRIWGGGGDKSEGRQTLVGRSGSEDLYNFADSRSGFELIVWSS